MFKKNICDGVGGQDELNGITKDLTNTRYKLQKMKKMWTENATLKISCERKRGIFEKIFNEHHIDAIQERIRVFLLGLDCKKNCIVRSRRRK